MSGNGFNIKGLMNETSNREKKLAEAQKKSKWKNLRRNVGCFFFWIALAALVVVAVYAGWHLFLVIIGAIARVIKNA